VRDAREARALGLLTVEFVVASLLLVADRLDREKLKGRRKRPGTVRVERIMEDPGWRPLPSVAARDEQVIRWVRLNGGQGGLAVHKFRYRCARMCACA